MIRFKVNGKEKTFDGDPDMPLLWYLRDVARLTGTKFGCGMSLCGACTVHHNGAAIRSCTTPMKEVSGAEITTIEGIAPMHPVQKAWMEIRVPQCGYCQTGQIMQAIALLKENKTSQRSGYRHSNVWQSVPLRHLSAHSRGDSSGRKGDGMKLIENVSRQNVSRRGFLQGALACGSLRSQRALRSRAVMGGGR